MKTTRRVLYIVFIGLSLGANAVGRAATVVSIGAMVLAMRFRSPQLPPTKKGGPV